RRRQGPPIGENLAEDHTDQRLVEKRRDARGLENLKRTTSIIDARNAWRHAIAVGIVYVTAGFTLLLDSRRPRRHLHIARFQILREIEEQTLGEASTAVVNGAFDRPDS